MFSLIQAFRAAYRLYRDPPKDIQSYEDFAVVYKARNVGSHWTERQVRAAYEEWRRDSIREEVRAELLKKGLDEVRSSGSKDVAGRINIATMGLILLAILFPPFYMVAGGETVSLGFRFVGGPQLGRVDAFYLSCELVAIVLISWFAHRTFAAESTARAEGQK